MSPDEDGGMRHYQGQLVVFSFILILGGCGGLNENILHRLLICLNAWFPVGRTVWEILGSVVLLEVCRWAGGGEV